MAGSLRREEHHRARGARGCPLCYPRGSRRSPRAPASRQPHPRRKRAVAVDTRDRIREFIKQEILFEDQDATLDDDTPLLSGIIDSLGLTQMVAFIEDEFDVEIDDG